MNECVSFVGTLLSLGRGVCTGAGFGGAELRTATGLCSQAVDPVFLKPPFPHINQDKILSDEESWSDQMVDTIGDFTLSDVCLRGEGAQ